MQKNSFRVNLFFVVTSLFMVFTPATFAAETPKKTITTPYAPEIKPENFTTTITNPYFSLPVGKKMTYEAKTDDGIEKVEIQILPDTKTLMGVKTITYWDRVSLNDVLVEETKDYLAQDSEGNVWYFGEVVDNYVDGKLVDHHGSWLAGENGALPGIWFPANPQVGDKYRQEYLKGEAEDISEVVAVGETVTTQKTSYKNCVKTYDTTPLDLKSREYKYYCPEVAALVVSDHVVKGEHTELITVSQEAPAVVAKDAHKVAKPLQSRKNSYAFAAMTLLLVITGFAVWKFTSKK